MPDPSPLQQLLLGTYKDSTPAEGKPKEPTTRTSKDVLSSLLQGEKTPYDNPEQEAIYQDYKLSSDIAQYVELGQGSNFQASDPTKTTFNPETIYQGGWSDWSNQLLNSIDAIDKSKWEGRANDSQHQIDLISKKLEDPNLSDADYVSLSGQLDEHIKELEESNQWAKEQQQNIDDNPITRSYAQTAEAFQQDENTNPWDYIAYELPTDLGGSASEVATMVGMMFGPEVLALAAEAAVAGSTLTPIGSAVLGLTALIGGGIAMYNMRSNETDAEAADAYNQKLETLTSEFTSTNGREPDYNELRDLRLDAYKGIDALKSRNMALSVGDYGQLALMLIPGSGLIKAAFSGAKLSTKIALNTGAFMGAATMEAAEEGDQWQIKQDYLKGILEDKGLFGTLEDSLKYRTTSLAALMGVDIPGVSDDVEFRNSMRSGLILGGGMSLGSSVKNTVSDIKDFKSSKEFVQNNRSMLFDQEITESKAKTYLNFFKNNKAGFLFSQLQNVDLSANPELNKPGNREAALSDAKLAKSLYETIKANEGSNKGLISTLINKFKTPNTNVDALFTEAYKVSTEIKKSEKLKTKYLTEVQSLLSDESGSLNPKVFTADVINTNAQILQSQEILKDAKNLLQKTHISEEQRSNIEALIKSTETKLVSLVENLNNLIPDTSIKRSTVEDYVPTSTKDIALAEVYFKLFPHEVSLLELQDQFVALVSKGKNDTKDKVFKAYEAKPKEEKNKKADKKAKEADKQANDELDADLNLDDISELSGTVSMDSEESETTPSTPVEENPIQEDTSMDIESEEELTSLDDLLNGTSETSEAETEGEATTEPTTTTETASSDIEQSNDTPTSKQLTLERAIAKVLRLGGIAKQSLIDNAGVYYTVNGTNYQRQSEYNADENTFTRSLKAFGQTLSKFRDALTNVDNGATVGNYIDIVSRELFNNSNLTFEEFNTKAAEDINYQYNFINTVETFNEIKKNIIQIKEELKAKHGGDKVRFITDPMFVFSNRTVDNYGGVGGALDMLVIDADNNAHIYDFKNKKGESKAAVRTNLITYKNTQDKWSKQQATYLQLFEETTGVKPVSTNIIVFPTMYKPDSFLGTTQEDVDSFKPIPKITNRQLISGDAFILELSGKADLRDNTVLTSETGLPIQPVVETAAPTSNLAETREFVVTADLENVETIDNINSAAELNKVEFDKEATKTNPYTTTWKSVNNTQATPLEKQDQRLIELSAFLENPDNNLSTYTVEFQIDVQYLKEHKTLGVTSLVDVVTGANKNAAVKMSDVSRLPVRCLFRDAKGNIAKNSMGNPHYIFLEDPIAGRFEKNSAKQAAIELADLKLKILRAHTQGVSISTRVESKSRGYVSFSKDETTGKFETSNVSSVLGIPSDSLNLVVGGKNKTYMTAKKQMSMDLMHIGNTATPGAVYVLIKDASGNMFPLRLHSSKLTKDECNLIVEIYSLLANNPKLFNSPIVVSESVINIIRESKDPRVSQLPIKLNEITHAQLLNTLLYEGRKVSTSKNKVFMNDVGQLAIGDKTFSKEELINNRGEIIALLSSKVTRQVNLKELSNKEYVKYLIDNNVVTTNAVPTTSKSIFAQPAITLSRDVKKETFKAKVESTPTPVKQQSEVVSDAKADIEKRRQEELKQPKVILPIGTSGSGKSTFIKTLPQENLVVIEPDAMRVEFTGDINNKSKDKEIYEEAAKRAVKAIKQGKQVVFDTTNLTKDKRTPFIEAIKKALPTANIQYKLMELNPELAKQRIKAQIEKGENRANVPDSTIDRHAESYKQMLEDIKREPITEFKSNEEINAKYDAELAALEGTQSTSTKDKNFNKEEFVRDIDKLEKEKKNGSKNIGLYSFKDKFVKVVKSKRKLSKENLNILRDRVSDIENVYPALEIIDLPNGSQAIVMDKASGKIGNELTQKEIDNIPQEHWDKFEQTIRELSKRGVQTDLTKRSNVLYDKDKGFQFIDLEGASIEGDSTNKFFKEDGKEYYYSFEKYTFFPKEYKSAKEIFTDIKQEAVEQSLKETTQQSTEDVKSKIEELKAKLARARSIKSKSKIQEELDALETSQAATNQQVTENKAISVPKLNTVIVDLSSLTIDELNNVAKQLRQKAVNTREAEREGKTVMVSSIFVENDYQAVKDYLSKIQVTQPVVEPAVEPADTLDITTGDASYADDIFGMGEVYQEELSEDVRKLIEFYGTLQQSSLDKLGYSTVEDLINEANTSSLATDEFIKNIKKCRS